MILVSACLLGEKCRYNGEDALQPKLKELLAGRDVVAICPELEAGFSVPRPPAEIFGGDGFDVLKGRAEVVSKEGREITEKYLIGIRNLLSEIELLEVECAVLKARSPACGPEKIYSGVFENELKSGSGVFAAFLKRSEIPVFSEDDLQNLKDFLRD
ncbi:MAG: DUF523 domain-containing protein [Halanaerobiales bacterium]